MSVFVGSSVCLVSDVVEKSSICRWSRIPFVVVEKITMRRREDGGVVVDKKYKKSTNFQQKILPIYLQATAITHTEILVAYFG